MDTSVQAQRPADSSWFRRTFADLGDAPVAYFCAEFGIDPALPMYAGGLGMLAGDHCKAASDLGVPLVAIGLRYAHGSFAQQIAGDGWQHAVDPELDLDALPLRRCRTDDGDPRLASIDVAGRRVALGAWEYDAGQTRLLLLDTLLPDNHPDDRRITDRLYGGGSEHRLRQEWVLGAGGVRVLRALGVAPGVWHANEGHAAFMMIERLREHLVGPGAAPLAEAIERVRSRTVFTTHTPVPAGHDIFDTYAVDRVCGLLAAMPVIERRTFHALGRHAETGPDRFHMTALAMRMSGFINGVSQLHGDVAREQWHVLWSEKPEAQVPITAITNGVHIDTWMAPRMRSLLDATLGPDWMRRDPADVDWARIFDINDLALWSAHEMLQRELLEQCREVSRRRWHSAGLGVGHGANPTNGHLASGGALLGTKPLTLGFARRFATYKRADLLLRDGERLERLLHDPKRPVQIIIAGKAHPADHAGMLVLQRVWRASRDPRFGGRIAFLENYDMTIARCLVQGVDLWLNLPRVPLEACGTSGMKAALNGVPQLATLDGWWAEGFTGRNGWALPQRSAEGPESDDEIDAADHEALFDLLEQHVVPLFFDRAPASRGGQPLVSEAALPGAPGVAASASASDLACPPHRWIEMMKHAMAEAAQHFSAARMVRQYTERAYVPAYRSANTPRAGRGS